MSKHKRPRARTYNPAADAMWAAWADALLLAHAERVWLSSTFLEALAKKDPRWAAVQEDIRAALLAAYELRNRTALASAVRRAEGIYARVARSYGFDPEAGEWMVERP